MKADPKLCGPWDVGHDEYHANHDWLGSSMVKAYRKDGPPRYREVYVTGRRPKSPPTEDKMFGAAFHLAALQPELFATGVVCSLRGLNLKSSKDRAKRDQFAAEHADKIVLRPELYDQIDPMLQATLRCPRITELLVNMSGPPERGFRWINDESGLPCKALIDVLLPIDPQRGRRTILDIKTSWDPRPKQFGKDAHKFGYGISAVHYCEAVTTCLNEAVPDYLLIVADKRPPYAEPAIYRLRSKEWILSQHWRQLTLNQMATCYEYDEWSPPGYGEVQELRFPGWAFTQ